MRKQPGELELFSTEELIDELMKRTTFQGVIVHARDGARVIHEYKHRLTANGACIRE